MSGRRARPAVGVRAATLLAVALAAASPAPAAAREIRLATWNIAWLTTKPTGHPDLPDRLPARTAADFRLLQQYAARLDADIVALQEVDGPLAAARVFDSRTYAFHFTQEADVQRVGFAIRRTLAWRANPDLAGLDLVPDARFSLRRGADITVEVAGRDLRLLTVHLRAGCLWDDLETPQRVACVQLARQSAILAGWIATRRDEGVDFALLGDFNRRLSDSDSMWRILTRAAPLARATGAGANPCWGLGRPFIDHIVLGGEARVWLVPGSLQVLTYRTHDYDAGRDRLSDHCPVSARLDPARAAVGDPPPARGWLWPVPAEPARPPRLTR